MENHELLNQIAELIEASEARTIQRIQDFEVRTIQRIQDFETRINLKVENEVTKRIDALFDGYKLTHEKQWELERQNEEMQRQIADLQARMAALENKIA